jgi:hypothetical protein
VKKKGIIDPFWLSKVINKWPAIIFAVRRIANVPGRIIFLVVSISTIKGIKAGGVPVGIKCLNIFWVLFNHPKNIKDNQIGNENDRLKIKWLVEVKI